MYKILAVSDQVDPRVYSDALGQRYQDVDLVISCGDLPYQYIDYIITTLDKPLYFVHGNHDKEEKIYTQDNRPFPLGECNIHARITRKNGLLLAGVEGSIQYNKKTTYQYTQGQFWSFILRLVPGLLLNKILYGRYLDIFISHAPPRGIHEGSDWTHQGIKAFRWLLDIFQPTYHFHGHVHLLFPNQVWESYLGKTRIVNAFLSRVVEYPWK